MSDAENRALLPEGLHDALAPKAEFESAVVTGLLAAFSAHGYEQVAPPLVELMGLDDEGFRERSSLRKACWQASGLQKAAGCFA